MRHHSISQQPPATYSMPYSASSYQTAGRKRSHQEHEPPVLEQQLYGQANESVSPTYGSQQGYSLPQFPPQISSQATLPPTHHHHLPNVHRNKRLQLDGVPLSPPPHHGPPSVVGAQGMPPPAPRPRGPKLKFTPEDDQLLVDLKEKKNLTWKQIADFFPGRSSGTLQVRYCTKLKAKTTVWTDEMVVKLRTAMQEYENDRWRIISSKVGAGFSPAACKDKADEFKALETAELEDQDHHQQQQQHAATAAAISAVATSYTPQQLAGPVHPDLVGQNYQ